jgi:hypothetical protein
VCARVQQPTTRSLLFDLALPLADVGSPPPFADVGSPPPPLTTLNDTSVTISTLLVNGAAVYLEGAAFFSQANGVDVDLLRAALAAAAAARGAELRIADIWLSTALTLTGLSKSSAASVGFEPAIAVGVAVAFLASALGVPPERITAFAPSFEPSGWRVELAVTGFEGYIADVNAAVAVVADPRTAQALGIALASLICTAGGEACVAAEAALAPPSVRAIAFEVGAAADLPLPTPQLDDLALTATLGVVFSGFGARSAAQLCTKRFLTRGLLRTQPTWPPSTRHRCSTYCAATRSAQCPGRRRMCRLPSWTCRSCTQLCLRARRLANCRPSCPRRWRVAWRPAYAWTSPA